MSLQLQAPTPGPPHPQLHQGIVVKYSGSTCVTLQKSSILLDNLNACTTPTLSKQIARTGAVIPHKLIDISLCDDATYVLLPTGQRLKISMNPPEDQAATSLFASTPVEDFVARPSLSFAGPEYLVCQTRAVVVYNALLKSVEPPISPPATQTDSFINETVQKHLTPYAALIFSNPQFLSTGRLLLDGSFRITNCAFDEYTVVLSFFSGHILFIDRTQPFQRHNIVDSSNYSYYGLISYAALAARLMKDFQASSLSNFSFREALRLLSISPSKHTPFFVFRGCDLVLAMPLGCIFIFTRHGLQDSSSGRLVLSHATIALPFVRHDLPNKSFKITHYSASRVSFFLPASETMLIVGYENSVVQYYCWDIDGMAHPLDGIDLSAGKITHIHAGLMLLPEGKDLAATPRSSADPIKVLIVATIGSTLFFIIQCFPKMTLLATVPAPERFVDCGKICSPTAQQFSPALLYTAIDGSLKYTHLPGGYLFRSGIQESGENAQRHEQQVKTIQRISTLLKNVTYQYESDESASELNVLNDRSKAAIPTFILSSSENEVISSSTEEQKPPKRSILDISNVKTKPRGTLPRTKRSRKLNTVSIHPTTQPLLDYNDAFTPNEKAGGRLERPAELPSISPFNNRSASSYLTSTLQPVWRPFEQIDVQLGNEPLLLQIQGMYSLIGSTHRRKMETGERVSYDDSSLTKLRAIRDTRDLIGKAALMTKNITISEYQKSVSPSLDIQKLLVSPQNLKSAMELLIRNDHIFRSSRNNILPHFRNAYLHLKRADQMSRKANKKTRSSIRLARPLTNQLTSSRGLLASNLLSKQRVSLPLKVHESKPGVRSQFTAEHTTGHKGSHAFRYLPTLARDLMLDGDSPFLMEPENVLRNAWSPSFKLHEKPNHLTNVIMRSRDRQAEMLSHGSADNFIGVLRSKVLEKPAERGTGDVRYKGKEKERPRVLVNRYEHIKVIDKELLKDLRRFKALRLGRDLGGRILRDKDVLTALLTGGDTAENLKDIIDLTTHDYMSLDDILSMGKNIISILDPENDCTLDGMPGSRLASKHANLGLNNTLDYEDPVQLDVAEIVRLVTPKDTSPGALRHGKSRSATRKDRFGFDLMNQLLRNFDYRLNKRRVRSGINGMLTISDDYTRTVLLRRSASLPTIETINRNRVELATKLDSALGYEMGISRWDEDANRDYRARILSIDRLSDPESSIWDTEETYSSSYSSISSDAEKDNLRIPVPTDNLEEFLTRKCASVAVPSRIGHLSDEEPVPRRAYSAKLAAEAALLNLEPLDLNLYMRRTPVPNNVGPDADNVIAPMEPALPADINELDPESLSDDDIARLSSASECVSSTSLSSSAASSELSDYVPSIFGIKGEFDPSQYAISSTYLPDILLRAALQTIKKQAVTITATKKHPPLFRDDCSQIFKAVRKPSNIVIAKNRGKPTQYGYNPLSRYCMQNYMFCPRGHFELNDMASRDVFLDAKRRSYSFDKLEPLILAKGKYGQKPNQSRSGFNPPLNINFSGKDCLSDSSDWSFGDDYDYLSFKPIKNMRHMTQKLAGNTNTSTYTNHQSISPATCQVMPDASYAPVGEDSYIADIKAKAFTTHTEALILERIKQKQTNALLVATELRNFKMLFTRELYEDWARLYRHNVIRKDTFYDDQFEVTVMKPTFPLYYHVITNVTEMDGMINNIANEDAESSELVVRAELVVTKAQFPFSASQNQSVDSLLDDMQLALGSWPEQQCEESIIPHHYAIPPKPPYYNPRIPIVDALDDFYDPASIVPLEPLLPDGKDGIRLQIGVFTPYAFCLKNPEFVDNEKLTTILNPVAYTNCKDIILGSSHCEQPRSSLAKYLREAGYPLPEDTDNDSSNLEYFDPRLDHASSFDTRVNEFIAAFFSLPKARSEDLATYHKGLYLHSVYSLPSHTEGFSPRVRPSMLTVGQAVKAVFTKYFQSYTPVQRKIMSQTAARGVAIDYNRLNYVPYSFLQLLLLYSAALAILQLLKGQRYASKQPEQAVSIPLSRRLQYILCTQFPVEPISLPKNKNKKDTYGRASPDTYTEIFFNFYSIQNVLTYSCENFVRYLLIIIYYVRLCNLETCISSFVDYQLRRVLKQDAYIQELSDPYRDVVRIYEQMETHICTVRSLQKVKEFSCIYEQYLQQSLLKATAGAVTDGRPFPFLTYFGPRSDPLTLSHMLAKDTDLSTDLLSLRSTTLAVVYNDSDLPAEALRALLSKYALSCMLDDTKMHIHGVYAAILNRFSPAKRSRLSSSKQYFPGLVTNLAVIPLTILILIRRLEEIESIDISRVQRAVIRRKLHIILLDAYLRVFTTHRIPSLAIFSPLVHMYVHVFRIPRNSNYPDYASMLRQRQQTVYKILYDASVHELQMRVHNNYVIQQPNIASVIGIPKADTLSNFFSTHFHPAYVASYAKYTACHKVIIGEGIYSEADDGKREESSHLDISVNSTPSKIYSDPQDDLSNSPVRFSWYTSLYNAVTKNPLTECVQREYKNRYSYDLYEDYMSLLEKVDQHSYKGNSQFQALVITNKFDEVRRDIEERRISLDRGCLSEEPAGPTSQARDDLPALGRSIFRNRVLDTLKSSIVNPIPRSLGNKSIIERSSAEELCISESLRDSVQAGERILANTAVQLLKTRNQTSNISKWTEIVEHEESNLEQSCIANPADTTPQNPGRASFDSTYELRKAFTDIRVPRYRTSSVLVHANTKRVGILLHKPLPSISADTTYQSSSIEEGSSPVRDRRSVSNS